MVFLKILLRGRERACIDTMTDGCESILAGEFYYSE